MADTKKTSVRLDDFVNAIHQDPANPQPTQLVSGFVGRGADEGSLRIYSDPGLGSWVEASAEDVVHSRPIDASPLGGSHVWLKGDAQLKPGSASSAGASAAQASAAVGGIGGDVGVFNPFYPTWTQHPTLGFTCTVFCPVNTAATLCTHAAPCGPLPTHAFICPTMVCPVQTLACPVTAPPHCPPATGGLGCPGTSTCPFGQGGEAQAFMAAAPTQAMGCPNTSTCTPPTYMLGCPGTSTCTPQTHMLGCPPTATCPPQQHPTFMTSCLPTHQLGCPGTSTCPPTHMLGCPGTSTCPPTHQPGCPGTSTCPPTHQLGCPGTVTCPPQGMPTWFTCLPTMPIHCLPQTLPGVC